LSEGGKKQRIGDSKKRQTFTSESLPLLICKWLYNYFNMVVVDVPTINKRKRIPQKAIKQVVKQIVEKFKPQKIILFGSYARGNPRPESDVDMLVVMDTPLREVQQAIQICQQIEYRFGLDLIVHTPKYLAERVKMGDSFLRDVLKEGKVVYEFGNG
jgi:uncharacterized protein